MNLNKRKTVIGGNWKMNILPSQVEGYAKALKMHKLDYPDLEIIIAVPYVMLPAALEAFRGTPVRVAAQNVSEYPSGAYTGEVSVSQLYDLGVRDVIVGHSERRSYFGDTNITVGKKVKAALAGNLNSIVCVGESAEIRDNGSSAELVTFQVKCALSGLTPEEISRVIIAYEPVWAIGTGVVATPEQAERMCVGIRSVVNDMYGSSAAQMLPIIYGGSMDSENVSHLLSMQDIDGGLIGKSSLSPESFAQIIEISTNVL